MPRAVYVWCLGVEVFVGGCGCECVKVYLCGLVFACLCIGRMLACVKKCINSTLYRVPRCVSVCTKVAL